MDMEFDCRGLDYEEEEEELALFAVKQEVEDLPTYDDEVEEKSDDDSPPMDKELSMDNCNVCEPKTEERETSREQKTTWTDQVRMIHLRRYIDQLAEKVTDKDYQVQKTREEFRTCNDRIQNLERERDEALVQIKQAKETDNVPASDRLTETYRRICEEIENENELLVNIKQTLDTTEYELSKAKVEQGKYLLKEDDLLRKEDKLQSEKTDLANYRSKKEKKYADNYVRQNREAQRQYTMSMEERERTIQHAIDQAEDSQAKHSTYLQRTVTKIRQREAEEVARSKAHMQQRMETMISLKKNIANNRENLRALQARDKALARESQEQKDGSVRDILGQGGNPDEQLLRAQKLEEMEKEKELHALKQREMQCQIATRILQEEDRIRRRKEQQPQLWDDPKREAAKVMKPHKKPKLRVFEALENDNTEPQYEYDMSKFEGKTGDESGDEDDNILTSQTTRENTFVADSDSDHEDNVVLAKPEFNGMWDSHKAYKVPKGDLETGPKMPGASKMEKDIMGRVLEKHREGIVIKQVAAGREFQGRPFYSKPDVIHFKDFDVGKTYKKKVTLTNVSYSVNYCKLLGITEHLKDFIHIHFDAPGQMSAGLTCEMLVTFKPMINEDLSGEVSFLAQTGPFAISLICTTKKCDLSVDQTKIDFGVSVIGETLKRHVTLTNAGALASKYEFFKMTGMKQRTVTTAETSLGRLTTADTMRNVSPDSAAGGADPKAGGESGKKKLSAEGAREEEKKDEDKPAYAGTDADDVTKAAETGEGGDMEDEDIPEIDGGSSMAIERMDDLVDLDGMTVGHIVSGEIGPFSSVKLEIVWAPTIPGKVGVDFAISFSDPASDNISINAVSNAIDVPVWVERQTVDLKICMFDRLFQDTIIVNNRATTALRLKFEVCKELRNHLELLPKTGYIQAQSQFSAQLKFLPRKTLFEEAGKYFDRETGVLEAPLTIRVADQTRPVPFTVHAVVTNSDMEFDVTDIDFGYCTIYEAVKKTARLSNKSILSQRFGFVGVPEYVDIQPNDGFGTLLPLETIELDIIFQPRKARDFNFELTCKSLINREFKISCKGVGVHPSLDLTNQVIHFAATAINDVSTAVLHVVNNHTSVNEFSHPVPRIGKGEIAPVGPTSFEFILPLDAPFSISPSVGTVAPGQRERIQLRFRPRLTEDEIRREAVRMMTREMERQAAEEWKRQQLLEQQQKEEAAKAPAGKKPPAPAKPDPKSKTPPAGKGDPKKGGVKQDGLNMQVRGPAPVVLPEPSTISKHSKEYNAAHASLLRQFKGRFSSYTVPCYIASGACAKPGELEYSVHNTLYLELHCPAIRPQLVVISDNGRTTLDFEQISIGQSVIKSMTIQNISDKPIDMTSSLLDPEGPFTMLNALRMLPPDASHTMLICFSPHRGARFQEQLEIYAPTSTLHITVKGHGISPLINLSIRDGCFDFGAIVAGEYREESFKISNTSELSIQYYIKTDSQSLLRYSKAQGLPQFVKRDSTAKSLIGTQNYCGQQVFDCVPANGIIPAGGAVDIVMTFAPDHPSDFYSDGVRIDLFGQEEQHVFQIKGQAKAHIMYLADGDELVPEVESLSVLPVDVPKETDTKAAPIPFLVSVRSVARETEFETGSTTITVGCVRTMAVSQKKGGKQVINPTPEKNRIKMLNGEWSFDNLAPIQQLGFNVDQPKGMMEAGTTKPVTITWTPPAGYDPNKPLETSINVTLRGDVVEVYRVILKGFVVSE